MSTSKTTSSCKRIAAKSAMALLVAAPLSCSAPEDVESLSQNANQAPVQIRVLRQQTIGTVDAATASAALAHARGEADAPEAYAEVFEEVQLPSAIAAMHLRGTRTELLSGGWLEVYAFYDGIDGIDDGVHSESDAEYLAATVIESSRSVQLDVDPSERDLRVDPLSADFERLQLVHHFNQAFTYLDSVGYALEPDASPMPIHYAPDGGVYRRGNYLVAQLEAVSNNAYFDQIAGFYWIAPSDKALFSPTSWSDPTPSVPVYQRYAIIVHEVGHQVVDDIVDLDREAYRTSDRLSVRTLNVYQTLHEAACDVFGAAATKNPDILGASERDLSVAKQHTAELEGSLDHTPEDVDWNFLPDEHARGAVIAHALWRAGSSDPDRLASWTIDALHTVRAVIDLEPELTYPVLLDAFADTAPSEWLPELCRAMDDTGLTEFHGAPGACTAL